MPGPPFKAEHVGSFLRPDALRDARAQHDAGSMPTDALRAIEDKHIHEVVRRQEDVGLSGITDGEFRRNYFHVDFLDQLDGVNVTDGDFVVKFRKADGSEVDFRPPTIHVDGRLRRSRPIQGPDFEYLDSVTTRTPKVSIPAPSMLHFQGNREAISMGAYPDLERLFRDLTGLYRAEIADLAARGCRYVQMDDSNLAHLFDPAIRATMADRGDDPDEMTRLYVRLINDSIRERPDDMVVSAHLCRGNFKSGWLTSGGYEPVAEILFGEMEVDAFFLEYDDERSGDFAPLRFVPADKQVVLGLMSSKRSEVEDADQIKRRIDEAGAFVSLDQCALSHQCGFASTSEGNALAESDQWRKLARTVEVASDVWGYQPE